MNERELVTAAQIFQANCGANKLKVSFADCLKVVLLSKLLEKRPNMYGANESFSPGEMELILKLVQGRPRAWYRFW